MENRGQPIRETYRLHILLELRKKIGHKKKKKKTKRGSHKIIRARTINNKKKNTCSSANSIVASTTFFVFERLVDDSLNAPIISIESDTTIRVTLEP